MHISIPLFSRALLPLWRLLIITACVLQNGPIQLANSDLTVGYNIEIGNVTETTALAKLSNGPDQQAWWKLANVHWHDSAIQRFFAAGPPTAAEMEQLAAGPTTAAEMEQLAAVNGKSDTGKSTDLKLAVQRISTASYQMNKSIAGTGIINASMWVLLFACVEINSCNEGYMTPLVAIPQQPDIDAESDDKYPYSYATLWLRITDTLFFNSMPSFIRRLPPSTSVSMAQYAVDVSEISNFVQVQHTLPLCRPLARHGFMFENFRSLLDASYGLAPGLECIKFRIDETRSFKLLVSLTHYNVTVFNVTASEEYNHLTTLEELLSLLHINASQWEHRPFKECSEEPMLRRDVADKKDDFLDLCSQEICISSNIVKHGKCRGLMYVRFLQSVITRSESCTYNGSKSLNMTALVSLTTSANVSCTMSPTNNVCAASIYFVSFNRRLVQFSPQSDWSRTRGLQTNEFSYAPHMTDSNVDRNLCVSSPLMLNTSRAATATLIRARAYLNSFIAEHNIAFTTSNGQATELANFLAVIMSTAISVILALTGSITNFLLRIICRRRPLHLDSNRHGSVLKMVKVSFQVICNVLLSVCSFLPVLYIAWSERNREKPFHTWDIGSNDQIVYSSFYKSNIQVRMVYLLAATSNYSSQFIIASTVVVCSTCVLVALCTAWRCKQVFDRYTLLQKYDSIRSGNGPSIRTDIMEDRETLFLRALRAIEMGKLEYIIIKSKVNGSCNVQMEELIPQSALIPTSTAKLTPALYHLNEACSSVDKTSSYTGRVDSSYESQAISAPLVNVGNMISD